jgi:hypothetical protein
MTIREYILNGKIKNDENRLAKLIEMQAPSIMITSLENQIAELKSGNLQIGGDIEVLDDEFISREFRIGRGGKQYIQINGTINFFPNAQYGLYIKRVS